MHQLILAMIIVVTTFRYLAREGWAPALITYTPELLGLFAAVLVVALGVRSRFREVKAAYWLIFAGIGLTFAASALANGTDAGPTFAAVRTYCRALPFFFLGALIALTPSQIRTQLRLLLVIAFLQLPIAWYQRATTFARGALTGDFTVGTLQTSGLLTIFLAAVACVLTAFYRRNHISLRSYIAALFIVLLPTTLNETKASIAFIPIALFAPFLLAEHGKRRLVAATKALVLLAIFGSIFVPIYDYYYVPRHGFGLVDFLTDPARVENYFSADAEIGDAEDVRRGDAITIPLLTLRDDPIHLALGLGPGNVSDSALGEQFTGAHFSTLGPFLQTLWTVVALELGFLGFGLLLVLMGAIFIDCYKVARRDSSITGTLALGWAGVVVIVIVGFFYKALMAEEALSYPFWYFSGLIAGQRMRLHEAAAPQLAPSRHTNEYRPLPRPIFERHHN